MTSKSFFGSFFCVCVYIYNMQRQMKLLLCLVDVNIAEQCFKKKHGQSEGHTAYSWKALSTQLLLKPCILNVQAHNRLIRKRPEPKHMLSIG